MLSHRNLASAIASVLLLLFAGCYETTLSLGTEDAATINPAYCGNWDFASDNPNEPAVKMIIRNIDGRHYYVEWNDPSKKEEKERVQRFIGWTAPVKDATFAHVRELADDGTIPQKHLILRIELNKDGALVMHHLNKDFLESQTIQTDADLKRVIEQNLDNGAMYDEEPAIANKAK